MRDLALFFYLITIVPDAPSTARLLTQTGCEAHMGNAINNEKKKGKLRFMMISDL